MPPRMAPGHPLGRRPRHLHHVGGPGPVRLRPLSGNIQGIAGEALRLLGRGAWEAKLELGASETLENV